MFLIAGELAAYKDFAVYFVGIGLPIILLSLGGITAFHFWKKRKEKKLFADAQLIIDQGENFQSLPLPPLTADDRRHVINKIRRQLSGYRARNVALRHDYLYYQKKIKPVAELTEINTIYMENFEDKIGAYEKQIAEMQNKIDMLETMPPPLNNEAHYLRQLLAEKDKEIIHLKNGNGKIDNKEEVTIANTDANENLLAEQQNEIQRLKNLIHEQEHINDLLYESREQVNFLQNQLEQRIKAAKVLEQRVAVISEELNQSQLQFHQAGKKILKTEETMQSKDDEMGRMRLQLDSKDNEILRLQDEVRNKADQMITMEKAYNELLHENELQKSAVANDREIIASYSNQLNALNEENEHLKNQLRQNKEVLYRFYKEIRSSVEEQENAEHEHETVAE